MGDPVGQTIKTFTKEYSTIYGLRILKLSIFLSMLKNQPIERVVTAKNLNFL